MNRLILPSILLLMLNILFSCSEEEEEPFIWDCRATTDHYGMGVLITTEYEGKKKLKQKEVLCWNDVYPYQISSGGIGGCGEGYEHIENPFMTMTTTLSELDKGGADPYSSKRYIDIGIPFICDDYSTQENFYNLISTGKYLLANSRQDFGNFIIEYRTENDQLFSSIYEDNSAFEVEVLEVVRVKPNFYTEPDGNNGNPAAVDVKLAFSCLLSNETGEIIEIKDAEVRGRFYRMSPWGYYWDDWGEGWDQ